MIAREPIVALAVLLCLSLLAAFSVMAAETPPSPGLSEGLPLVTPDTSQPLIQRAPRLALMSPSSHEPGYVPLALNLSHLGSDGVTGAAAVAEPPRRFDWRDEGVVTPVRDQSTCGACYAFGFLGSFESKLEIDGAGTFDFSENNAKECPWRDPSCGGGNGWEMAGWFSENGTVDEACDPYVAGDVSCKDTCPYIKTLLDWRYISQEMPDATVLKNYIHSQGPVMTSMYAGDTDDWQSEFSGYDGSYTLYHPGMESANHMVLIVGWDDDLAHDGGEGGWIVKNSWGTGWGDGGYFRIAYGSAGIGRGSAYVHGWQDYDPNGALARYDEGGMSSAWGCGSRTAWALAQFAVTEDTYATRVEFFTLDETTDVDVYLYDDFDGIATSDLLWSDLNQSFDEAGYHGVAVAPPLAVTAGQDVAAVVRITDASYEYPIPADSLGPNETGRTYFSCDGTAGHWSDLGAEEQEDVAVRLRMSTSPRSAPTVTSITPNSGFYTETIHITDLTGSNFQPGADVTLTKSGQLDVDATDVTVVSTSSITCQLDLTGAATGWWDVVVTNPDSLSGTLPDGFQVRSGDAQSIYLPLVLRSHSPSGPATGFWEGPGIEFYVTPDRSYVDDFAIYVRVTECGDYKITHMTQELISDDEFSFSGDFYATGTFSSATTASGTVGLDNLYISGCGPVSGGPWPWDASWQSSSQPSTTSAELETAVEREAEAVAGETYKVTPVESAR